MCLSQYLENKTPVPRAEGRLQKVSLLAVVMERTCITWFRCHTQGKPQDFAILSHPRKCRGAENLTVFLGETNDCRFNHRQVEDNRDCNPFSL